MARTTTKVSGAASRSWLWEDERDSTGPVPFAETPAISLSSVQTLVPTPAQPTGAPLGVAVTSTSLSLATSVTATTTATGSHTSGGLSEALFTAILAMDAYNRGYGAKLGNLSDAVGTRIGDAIITRSDNSSAAQDVGFYGISYDWNGKKVIAYRGTDQLIDTVYGWPQGAGIVTSQARLAESFYQAVTGRSAFDHAQGDVVMTGHSLGGGLAGYVSAMTHGKSFVFDSMPYTLSAINSVLLHDIALGLSGYDKLSTLLTKGAVGGYTPLPDESGITSIHVQGEMLELVRGLTEGSVGFAVETVAAAAIVVPALEWYNVWKAPILGYDATSWASKIDAHETGIVLDSHSGMGLLGSVALHSQPLLILLQYASESNHAAWHGIGEPLIAAFQSDAIAATFGLTADVMDRQIAYSALNSGTMPFGDSGIRALFDDADQLGTLYAAPNIAKALQSDAVKADLAGIVTEYAGLLAANADTSPARMAGILQYDAEKKTLGVDLSDATWNVGATKATGIYHEQDLVGRVLGAKFSLDVSSIDYIVVATASSGAVIDVAKNNVLGHDYLLRGSVGDDKFYTGTGSDIVAVGGGHDEIHLGLEHDQILIDYASLNPSNNLAVVHDFQSGKDAFDLSSAIFQGLGTAGQHLDAKYFWSGNASTGQTADSKIVYNEVTGDLLYDADGNGTGAALAFAHLDAHGSHRVALLVSDFWIV